MQHRVAFIVGVPIGALGLALSWGLAIRDVIAPAIHRCAAPSVTVPTVAALPSKRAPIPFLVYDAPHLPLRSKWAPMFVLGHDAISTPEPKLPDLFRRLHAGRTLRAMCLGKNGHVSSVDPLRTLMPDVDGTLRQQLRTWHYRPQATPVCSAKLLTFNIP